jgi:hypothetical protein
VIFPVALFSEVDQDQVVPAIVVDGVLRRCAASIVGTILVANSQPAVPEARIELREESRAVAVLRSISVSADPEVQEIVVADEVASPVLVIEHRAGRIDKATCYGWGGEMRERSHVREPQIDLRGAGWCRDKKRQREQAGQVGAGHGGALCH